MINKILTCSGMIILLTFIMLNNVTAGGDSASFTPPDVNTVSVSGDTTAPNFVSEDCDTEDGCYESSPDRVPGDFCGFRSFNVVAGQSGAAISDVCAPDYYTSCLLNTSMDGLGGGLDAELRPDSTDWSPDGKSGIDAGVWSAEANQIWRMEMFTSAHCYQY